MASALPPLRDKADDGSVIDTARRLGTEHIKQREATDEEEHRLLIERITETEPFSKSSRLSSLLRHLAKCTAEDDRAGLTEQAIGHAVFGKPKDFVPAEDSLVRVNMRQLRLRLHEYYQGAGKNERIVVEIPKGRYALVFYARYPQDVPPTPPNLSQLKVTPDIALQAPHSSLGRMRQWLPWGLFACALLAAVVGWSKSFRASIADVPPWPINRVIEPGRQTTMVLADVSYILRMLSDHKITLDEYAEHKYADALIPKVTAPGELMLLHYLHDSQITSMADARAVAAFTTLAGAQHDAIVIRSAKELSGNALSNGNFILVGAKNSNPWVELYEGRMNFRLVEGGSQGARYIENRSPQQGESQYYAVRESTGYSGEDYATISLLPGVGDHGATLIVQGLRREGTDAAISFLSNPGLRASLEKKLRAVNDGGLPDYFEALLQSHAIAGSATSVECIAVHLWRQPH